MVLPLGVATTALVIGGALGTKASGVIWGVIAAAGLLGALRLGRIEFTPIDYAILSGGMISSTVLAVRVMPEAPESVDVILSLGYTLAWLPAAASAAVFAFRRGSTPSQSVNVALAWVAGAAIALSAGVSFGVIEPIESLRRGMEPVFGGGHYAVTALAIGLIGIAAMFAAVDRLPALAAGSAVVFMTVYAGSQVGFTIPGLIENISNIVNVPNLLPPDFDWAMGDAQWWELHKWEFGAPNRANPLVETIRIAIVATVLGVGLALPLAFLASTLTTPNRPSYLIDKGFINLIRTVPDLFWALIFATSVGVGPFAGALALIFFSLAIMSKLLSETVDSADPGPLEAAKSTGSSHFPAVRASVLPQVLPNYVAYALYIFEINIRASVVLGIVGAGGIGRVLETQRSFFRFDRVLAIVILIFAIVFVIEQVSIALRRRLV
ncbi:MAG: phosphonate ABC transporter, permease protein PhnE [Acidimicrobiia bacterium]